VRFASALATNDKLLTKHVREVSQRLKQSDKNSEHKNPYKMAIFPVGIPYSLQKPKNSYCRDIAIFPCEWQHWPWRPHTKFYCSTSPPQDNTTGARGDLNHIFTLRLRTCSKIFEPGVKRNFWPLRIFWLFCRLFCFSEYRNKVWRLLYWCVMWKLKLFGKMSMVNQWFIVSYDSANKQKHHKSHRMQ